MGKRQETREKIEAQIIELGRRHLVTEGAAGLSLRAIARDLGMVSSAVYRYVASRDDLLTLLLVDAYSELADAVDRAGAAAGGPWREQLLAMAHAARAWAVESAGPLGAAVRQPGARLPRAAGAHCRSGDPGRRRAVRRNRVRNCGRRHIADQCCCGPTIVVGLRPDTRGVRVRRRRLRGGQVLSAVGRTGRVRSASRCSVSTAPTR